MEGVVEAQRALAKLRQGQVRDVLQIVHDSMSPLPEGAVTRLDGPNVAFAEQEQQWLHPTSMDTEVQGGFSQIHVIMEMGSDV